MTRLSPKELRSFLFGQTLHGFDPDSLERVATVTYHEDGICRVTFADGSHDHGEFGLSQDTYWTRYTRFRAGETNHFYLEKVAPEVAQAYHTDGRRAFLQSPNATLERPLT